jgi:2-(1,2-epoxy-1,2-dihydrophenyl)acetyl-CoA isomerase
MAASEPSVLMRREGAVTIITLNRPDRLNSFTVEMHAALAAALDEAASDPGCRALVLTGAGRGFCAGQDLADRAVAPGGARPDLGESLEQRYNPLVRRMRGFNKPIIVAVNGVAAGAGANIALHGDIVIAARSARFIQSFAKIGLMPDSGGAWLLTRLLGEARAKALTLLAEPLGADEAAAWGLIWKAVDDADLMTEALALAGRLAAAPPLALAAIKDAVHEAATITLDAQLDRERDTQRRLGLTDDYAEGVAAFAAKRAPEFRGS